MPKHVGRCPVIQHDAFRFARGTGGIEIIGGLGAVALSVKPRWVDVGGFERIRRD
ncbi:hypothetical protein D3C75_1022430 [compost metagenome]